MTRRNSVGQTAAVTVREDQVATCTLVVDPSTAPRKNWKTAGC